MSDKTDKNRSAEDKLPKLSHEFIKKQVDFITNMHKLELNNEEEENTKRLHEQKEKEMLVKCGIYGNNYEDEEKDL